MKITKEMKDVVKALDSFKGKVVPLTTVKKNRTQDLITELYWDYHRLTSDGQQALETLAKLWGVPTEEELKQIDEADAHIDAMPCDVEPRNG